MLKCFPFHISVIKLAFEFCHNSLGRSGPGNILLFLQLNDFRRQESNSFISSFLHSVCSVLNFELIVIYLIWKSLPSRFDMLYPAVFNFKFLSQTVNIMYFFPQNFGPYFQLNPNFPNIFTDIWNFEFTLCIMGFPGGSDSNLPAMWENLSLIPGSGISPGEGNGYPLHYSCLESLMDRGAWWAPVHRVAKSRIWLSN